MSLRELIILLLGLAIVGIILRGLYVALQARRGQLRMAIDKNIPSDIDLEALELAELPGGGARVVTRDSIEDESAVSASLEAANQRAESLSLGVEDEAVPVLMDSVEVGQVAQIDTAASNSTQDDDYAAKDESQDEPQDEWEDEWTEGEVDYQDAGAATPEDSFEAGSTAGEPASLRQRRESPAVTNSQDLFDEEPGAKQDPRLGDMRSYAESATDACEAADAAYGADDEYYEHDEESPADCHYEIGSARPAAAYSLSEADAEASEHPDDVLFDYDSDGDDSEHLVESEADGAYAERAASERGAGIQSQYISESPDEPVYEDDAYEDDEEEANASVFLSEHADLERMPPRTEAKEESYPQDYEDAHGEQDDYTEEFIGEDDEHEVADQSQASEDEFAEFSMTAGERIGGNPTTEKQAGLFDQFDEPERTALAARGRTQKKPSLFASLKRRFAATDSGIEELSASSPDQPFTAPEQHAEPDLVDRAEEALVERVAGDVEKYEVAADTRVLDNRDSPAEQPAAEVRSEFHASDNMGWDEVEDSEPDSRWGGEHEALISAEADSEFERIEAEPTRASHEGRQIDWAGAAKSESRQQAPVSQPSEIKQQAPAVQPSEVIVLNVVARSGREFRGDDLLEVLITSGLKFGEMNIFHQRFRGTSNGPVIFSVANILNPGTFDLNSIHEFSTVGVSLFLALPSPINNLEAFDQMLAVAQRIREELDGELKDDHRNVMTAQTIEHYRQRIRDFALRQLKAAGGRA